MGFLRMATTGIVAQIHGRGDMQDMRTSVARAALVGLIFAITILIFQGPIGDLGISLVGGTDEVKYYAQGIF